MGVEVIHPWLDPALIAGTAACGIAWWQRHAIRPPRPQPEVPLVAELQDTWVEMIWKSRVAGNDLTGPGCLPGTHLLDVRRLDRLDGWEAIIQLQPGRQSTTTAMSATDMVCSAFELPAGSVIIEPTSEQTRSLARLQIIKRSPLYDVVPWRQLSLGLNGLLRIGTYADGLPAHVRCWEPGSGAVNMLVAGAPGSGKSQFMSLLLAESMRARFVDKNGIERPLVETWLGCGQAGQSFPDWARCRGLRWMATTTTELMWMVWRAQQLVEERSRYLTNLEWVDDQGRTRHGMAAFDPVATGLPYVQIVIDEAAVAMLAHPMMAAWLLDIAKRGRKNGIRVVLATQSPGVNELGGNSDLRAMLAAGNVVVFRVGDGNHGSMAFPSGECGNPAEIPSTTPGGATFQGAGFVAGPDNRGRALMRTLLLEDPFAEATAADSVRPLSAVDAAGGGELLETFWVRQQARWAGEDPEPGVLAAMAERDAQAALAAAPGGAAGAEQAAAAAGRAGGAAPVPGGSGRPSIRVLVMNALEAADGNELGTGELVTACSAWWSERSVTNELRVMREDGAIERPTKGRYRLAEDVAATV